jgi:hypothetical protein
MQDVTIPLSPLAIPSASIIKFVFDDVLYGLMPNYKGIHENYQVSLALFLAVLGLERNFLSMVPQF